MTSNLKEYHDDFQFIPTSSEINFEGRKIDNNIPSYGEDRILYRGSLQTTEEDFGNTEHISNELDILTIPQRSQRIKRSPMTIMVLRTHHTKIILENLDWLAANHEPHSPGSMGYFSNLLNTMDRYIISSFDDPFSSFLSALYDGLVHNDSFL